MSVIETRVSPVAPADYAQAVLNMLEDLSSERERMVDSQPAMLNILEDFDAEKTRLEQGHVAMLNILEDLDAERSEIVRLNQELTLRVRELERSNRNLETFTYTVAHDLRAPLRGMSGFAGALLDDYGERLDPTGREYAQRIRSASGRMAKLIEDVLRLARVSRAEIRREPVDLSALVREIVADLRSPHHPDRVAELQVENGITASVDRVLFRTVLQNLLDNAWKFTADREPARIAFVGVVAGPGEACFCVRDNGVGFDAAHTDALFEPFQSLHSVRDYPGTGVGLASVKQVVELHGGRIWAQGAVDEGAAFYVALPDSGANRDPQPEGATN